MYKNQQLLTIIARRKSIGGFINYGVPSTLVDLFDDAGNRGESAACGFGKSIKTFNITTL